MSSVGPHAVPYPRFSDDEMAARRRSLSAVLARHEVDHALVYGANRSGTAVGWLTRWPVTREALVIVTPGERDVLFVQFHNHVPQAQRMAMDADVRFAGVTMMSAQEELERRGGKGRRIGIIGPLGYADRDRLAAFASEVVDLNHAYTRLRLVKSREEIDWLRVGVSLTDAGMENLRAHARPGMSEMELAGIIEEAYAGRGGTTHIHYLGATSMSEPDLVVPRQWPSRRRLAAGDVLISEISASFWDYPGQLLRTFAVQAHPSAIVQALHDVADAAFDAILQRLRPGVEAAALVEAAEVIEQAGFTTRDDLVHGFVGGYLPPVLGSRSRTLEPIPDFTFRPGMVVVVQPNPVTRDGRAGVQTGELVLVGERGPERLHEFERGIIQVG
jgi:Xaa-Pro dipeptidase